MLKVVIYIVLMLAAAPALPQAWDQKATASFAEV
jgi:hypothetical protein